MINLEGVATQRTIAKATAYFEKLKTGFPDPFVSFFAFPSVWTVFNFPFLLEGITD